MQQLVSEGFEDFKTFSASTALRQIEAIAPREPQGRMPLDKSQDDGAKNRISPSPAHPGVDTAPRCSLGKQNGSPSLRIDHPVRDSLDALDRTLSEFVSNNMRGMRRIGLEAPRREPVQIAPMIEALKDTLRSLELFARERGDGFATSLLVRRVSSEASTAVEHVLIDLVANLRDEQISDNDVPEVLHTFANLKQALRQLNQHFDGTMLQMLQESGQLKGSTELSKQKPAA